MDQTKNQKQQYLNRFIKSHQFHRKLTQLLLSVSVFSLFFSRSYCLSLLLSFNNFNFHNSLPFQSFSFTIDKNCIFLLCNGLLVFLAKNSGLISSSSMSNLSDDDEQLFKSYEVVPQSESSDLEPKPPLLQNEVTFKEEEDDEKWGLMITMEEEEEEEEEEENGDFVEEEEEVELVEGNAVLTTDELNKRFDEFIRKMKEELRIEARQQSVTV